MKFDPHRPLIKFLAEYMGVVFFWELIDKIKNRPYLTLYLIPNFNFLGEGNSITQHKEDLKIEILGQKYIEIVISGIRSG